VSEPNCAVCPLINQKFVPSELKNGALYTMIGEGPGWHEVQQGRPFVGPSGDKLWKLLAQVGITRDQCNVLNVTSCMPPGGDEAKEVVVNAAAWCCKDRVKEELKQCESTWKLFMGKVARETHFPEQQQGMSLTTVIGRWVGNSLATYHPAFIMRDPKFAKTFIEDVVKFAAGPTKPCEVPFYEVVTSLAQLEPLLDAKTISYDLETDQIGLDNDILLMVLAANPYHAFIVPGAHPGAPYNLLYRTKGDPFWFRFWYSNINFVGHNGKFDARFLRYQLGWPARIDFDTMLAHCILDERTGGDEAKASFHDLKGLAARYLDEPDWEVGLHKHLSSRNDYYSKIPFPELCQYAAYDATRAFSLAPLFKNRLVNEDLHTKPFMNITMPLADLFTEAETIGVHVDVDYVLAQQKEFSKTLIDIEKQIATMSGNAIENLNSPPQVAHYLYDILKLPQPHGRKIKPRSTNKDALEALKGKHLVIDLIHQYRRIHKLQTSYFSNVLEMLDHNDDAHFDTKIAGTEIGRLAIVKPAMLTIPRADDREVGQYGKIVKNCYVPHLGNKFGACDYGQAELRIAAAESGDEFLLGVYRDKRSLHKEVSIAMYGADYTKTQYMNCKMFNFSYLYGGNEHSFADGAGLPIEVARKFVQDYNRLMPRLLEFKQEQYALLRKQGYVRTRTGRKRRLPLINNVNEDEARKSALHAPIAGGAADCTSLAAIRCRPKIASLGARVVLTVHDSILVEFPDNIEVERKVIELVHDEMIATAVEIYPEVLWEVDSESGYRWGSMQSL